MQCTTILALPLCLAISLAGQSSSPAVLQVSLLNPSRSAVNPQEAIEIRLSRPLQVNETIALVAGDTDISAFIQQNADRVRFIPATVLLAAGEVDLKAYLVNANHVWIDAGTLHLKVGKSRARTTTETGEPLPQLFTFQQSTSIQFRSQPFYQTTAARPFQRTFQELNLQSTLIGRMHTGHWNTELQANFAASNAQQQAVRYSQLGATAPQVDLSSYSLATESKRVKIWIGDQAFGTSRHLLNSFANRGIRVMAKFGGQVDVSAALVSGAVLQGYGDMLGIGDGGNRIATATLGLELRKSRPGSARVEFTGLHGTITPFLGSQAEENTALGARFAGDLWKQRLLWEVGAARSLDTEGSHGAAYLDLSFQVIHNLPLTKRIKTSWTTTFREERVDPGYRSAGAFVQPDRAQRQFEASGTVGAFQFILNHGRFEDNLARAEFQWKTYTHQTSFTAELPFREFFGLKKNQKNWVPRLTYNYFGLRNFSAEPPKGAELDGSLVLPDQKVQAHNVALDWGRRVRFGYRFSFDGQQNYGHVTHTATYGLSWGKKLDLNGEAGVEQTTQIDSHSWSARVGGRVKWKPDPRFTLSLNFSGTRMRAVGVASESMQGSMDAQAQWKILTENLEKRRRVRAEWYARYSNRYQFAGESSFGLRSFYRTQYFQTGFTVTFL